MDISKMGLKILKHLKRKSDKFTLELDNGGDNYASLSTRDEIKKLFPKCSYERLHSELKSLLDQKLIFTNTEDSSSFPSINMLKNQKINFGISGKGGAYVEQRVYMFLSKYLPFIISSLSLIISFITLFLKINN